jgi:hypothetical protein
MRRARIFLIAAVFTAGFLPAYAAHVPVLPDGSVELENSVSALFKIGKFTPSLGVEWRLVDEGFESPYRALTLGSYYRVSKNLKVGAFYRVQQGARHDDDWIVIGTGWGWRDTKDRTEQVLIADVTPRFLLGFLPGENWVFALKNRYLFNAFNDQHTLAVRPGLTYFLLKDRAPFINLTVYYDMYFPLNYGSTLIYAQWPSLDALLHLSTTLKADFSVSYKTVTWSTSDDVWQSAEPAYEVRAHALVFGLGILTSFGE